MKRCPRCDQTKPTDEFRKNRARHDGLSSWCGECMRDHYKDRPKTATQRESSKRSNRNRYANDPEYRARRQRENAEWRRRNPEKAREHQRRVLLKKYGLTTDEYEAMVEAAGSRCQICGRPDRSNGRRLSVDHCHENGHVRGVLCWQCNGALGMIGEENLMRAIEYLEETMVRKIRETGVWP